MTLEQRVARLELKCRIAKRVILVMLMTIAACAGPASDELSGSPATEVYLNELPPAGWSQDVMAHLSKFKIGTQCCIEDSAKAIEGKVERPWTVERLAAAYACTLDPSVKGHLLYLLAASRNPKALVAVGSGLSNPSPDVQFWATIGIDNFWMEHPVTASADARMYIEACKWWAERAPKLYAAEKHK